jgi:hypothetical protein
VTDNLHGSAVVSQLVNRRRGCGPPQILTMIPNETWKINVKSLLKDLYQIDKLGGLGLDHTQRVLLGKAIARIYLKITDWARSAINVL